MFKTLGNYLITGIVIVLPLTVTLFVLGFLINNIGTPVSEQIFSPVFRIMDMPPPASGPGKVLMDVLATLVVLLLITVIGAVSRFVIGRVLIGVSEAAINKIPVIGAIYRTVKQIVDTFSKENTAVFQHAVLIEFPRKGLHSIGFVTGSVKGEIAEGIGAEKINVFVPTTPNPTSGFLVMLPKEEIIFLDMTVGEGLKLLISGGAVAPVAAAKKTAEHDGGENAGQ